MTFVFGIMSIHVVRITKAGYRSKASEFLFAAILRHVAFTVYTILKIALFVESMIIDKV